MIWNAHFVMPFHQIRASFVAGQIQDTLVEGHMWVPTDDENCMVYNWMYAFGDKALAAEKMAAIEHVRGRGEQDQTADFRKIRNKDYDWLIDRQVQKLETFTGIDGINTHDHAITESMGPIVDRTQEHLGSTDRAVVIGRHLLIQAAHKVRQGADPMGLQPSYYNIRALGKILPAGMRWQDALKTELFPDGSMKPARNPVASSFGLTRCDEEPANSMESIGMLILRLTLGLIFGAHGTRQFDGWFGGGGMEDVIRRLGLRPAKLWASLAGLGNLCGGIMITLGAFTFLRCALIITTMLVAMLTIKAHSGFWERYSGYEMKLGAGIQRFGNARELYRRQGGSRRLQQIFGLGSGLPWH